MSSSIERKVSGKRHPESARIMRHGDKGSYDISNIDSEDRLSPEDKTLIKTVLTDEEFASIKSEGKIPLTLEGIIRSLKLGEVIFTNVVHREEKQKPLRQVLVAVDSDKPRASLTRALATAKVAQLEAKYNSARSIPESRNPRKKLVKRQAHEVEMDLTSRKKYTKKELRLDMFNLTSEEIHSLLQDADESTWGPYDKMMKQEGITEQEALLRWIQDMNIQWHQGQAWDKNMTQSVDESAHPKEGAERYKKLLEFIAEKVTAKNKRVPVHLLAFGHSGPLAQIQYDHSPFLLKPDDMPQFCQMYNFNEHGEFIGTIDIGIEEPEPPPL